MEILIVTGMSGAGKNSVLKNLEDMGYYCVDNMPPALIPKFASLCMEGGWVEKPSMIMDIRGRDFLSDFMPNLEALNKMGIAYKILFLDSSNETLVKRYKENRRTHPLSQGGRVYDDIVYEREKIAPIKEIADLVIDTTDMSLLSLRDELTKLLDSKNEKDSFSISVVSFGYKYGIPIDSDLAIDVRFIPNPFYIKHMKHLSGMDEQVVDYVMSFEETNVFLNKFFELVDFLIPKYKREGKGQLVISIGCTGGRHRSVAIAERFYKELQNKGINSTLQHRDIQKDGRGVST